MAVKIQSINRQLMDYQINQQIFWYLRTGNHLEQGPQIYGPWAIYGPQDNILRSNDANAVGWIIKGWIKKFIIPDWSIS